MTLKTDLQRIIKDILFPDMYVTVRQLLLLKKVFGRGKLIVEIGSFYGETTKRLAKYNRVIAIDPMLGIYDNRDKCSKTIDYQKKVVISKLKKNISKVNALWLQERSEDLLKRWNTPIDCLFIDGEHTLKGVKRDSEWIKFVKKGGFFAFHDVDYMFPEIKQFVEDKIVPNYEFLAKRGSLWIFSK